MTDLSRVFERPEQRYDFREYMNAYLMPLHERIDRLERLCIQQTTEKHTNPTAQFFKEYSDQSEKFSEMLSALAEQIGTTEAAIKTEVYKFCDYWTEPNSSGTRLRWQTEKTFDVSRRLRRWLNNAKTFNGSAMADTRTEHQKRVDSRAADAFKAMGL